MPIRRRLLSWTLAALMAVVTPLAVVVAVAETKSRTPIVFTGLIKGVAVGGYDPVAYFTQGKPVAGRADITHSHQGATWRFASEENRAAFAAAPDKYAPQYGGHCAWAVANGYSAKGDPNAWTIHGGKLYLNYNQSVKKGWEKSIPANIAKGDANWPKLTAR